MTARLFLLALGAFWLLPSLSTAQTNDEAAKMMMPGPRPRPIPLPEPIPGPPGEGWVWVPPVYRTVSDWVWRDGHYQTVTQRVWVPDQYGWRTVCYWENGRWVQRQEWVLISPGHYETRTNRVWIEGGWRWETRQELVTPGRWEWRGYTPPPVVIPQPRPSPRPPELAPFSPLWEWPEDSKTKK